MRIKIKGKVILIVCRSLLTLITNLFKLLIRVVLSIIGMPSNFAANKLQPVKFNNKVQNKPEKGEPIITDIHEDDCPEFQEIFNIDKDTVLGIEFLTRNPDETAVIRILTEDSFSKQYKRKVYSDYMGKYIKVDREKLYLKKAIVYLD